ncbi:hypothetical protein BRO10_11135, partial [Xanthomonas oryzae pv. oryzae]
MNEIKISTNVLAHTETVYCITTSPLTNNTKRPRHEDPDPAHRPLRRPVRRRHPCRSCPSRQPDHAGTRAGAPGRR